MLTLILMPSLMLMRDVIVQARRESAQTLQQGHVHLPFLRESRRNLCETGKNSLKSGPRVDEGLAQLRRSSRGKNLIERREETPAITTATREHVHERESTIGVDQNHIGAEAPVALLVARLETKIQSRRLLDQTS